MDFVTLFTSFEKSSVIVTVPGSSVKTYLLLSKMSELPSLNINFLGNSKMESTP